MAQELDQYEEVFAQGLAMGFTARAAAEEAGLGITPIEAQMLSQRPEIKARVKEIITLDEFDSTQEHLRIARQLEIDRDFAYQIGNPAAAIQATVQRGKLLGVFVERVEQNTNVAVRSGAELTPEEWAAKFGTAPKQSEENDDATDHS